MNSTMRWFGAAWIAVAATGCSYEGPWMQVWWGDLASEGETASFEAGAASALSALAYDLELGGGTATGLVLVGSWSPATCSTYVDHMRELDALVAEVDGLPLDADTASWVCERLAGLARSAYGDAGDHRAVHAIVGEGSSAAVIGPATQDLELTEAGVLDPASVPGPDTYTARVLEWGAPQLPGGEADPGGRCTGAVLGAWDTAGSSAADGVRAGAFRRYTHRYNGEPTVARADGGDASVGFAAESWASASTGGASVVATLFTDAPAIAGSTFPQMVVGTEGASVSPVECPEAAAFAAWAFPEITAGGSR